eukprot:1187798-Prorocentrum_minimum.AAC.4
MKRSSPLLSRTACPSHWVFLFKEIGSRFEKRAMSSRKCGWNVAIRNVGRPLGALTESSVNLAMQT